MILKPSIIFEGNAQEAIQFYTKIFQGQAEIYRYNDFPEEFEGEVPAELAELIMEATISCPGFALTVSDSYEEVTLENNHLNLQLIFEDIDHAQAVFNQLKDGGSVLTEFEVASFSAGYGLVKDPFGIKWEILVSE